jgi:integrase
MSKRASGEGHVRLHKSGVWEARLFIPKRLRSLYGGRREVSFYAKDQSAALEKRAKAKREMDEGYAAGAKGDTFAAYLRRWLDALDTLGSVSRRTAADYRYYSEHYLIPNVGDVQLSRLGVEDFDVLYASLTKKGVGPRTVNHVHSTARVALQRAVKKRLISYNPVRDADVPRYSTDSREYRTLSWDEVRRFFEAVRGDRFEAYFVVAVLAGIRPHELRALHWEDVDLESKTATIRRAVEEIDGQKPAIRNTTKTRKPRIVPLLPEAVTSLRAHKASQNEERLGKAGLWKDRGLVFPDALGGIMRGNNLSRRHFKPALQRAGLPKEVRLYDLRHTFATLWLQSGERVSELSGILGHARISTTVDNYIHPDNKAREEAMQRFGGAIRREN